MCHNGFKRLLSILYIGFAVLSGFSVVQAQVLEPRSSGSVELDILGDLKSPGEEGVLGMLRRSRGVIAGAHRLD